MRDQGGGGGGGTYGYGGELAGHTLDGDLFFVHGRELGGAHGIGRHVDEIPRPVRGIAEETASLREILDVATHQTLQLHFRGMGAIDQTGRRLG